MIRIFEIYRNTWMRKCASVHTLQGQYKLYQIHVYLAWLDIPYFQTYVYVNTTLIIMDVYKISL